MYQAPRGTYDVLPSQQPFWRYVESSLSNSAQSFGYSRIDTPIFEDTNVFLRSVGLETDIIGKEMYTFQDRGGQDLSLRPEGTAAVCRAYIEHGMQNSALPVRLFYYAPMFRYDRPQAGRYRQLQQFGVEAIGDPDPALDLEVIELAMSSLQTFGLKNLRLVINSIGDKVDRPSYIKALKKYLEPHYESLGKDDQRRLEINPLRILDSKDEKATKIAEAAPKSTDFLGSAAKQHWESLLKLLDFAEINYEIDHKLVRGLDYYTRTVFEIQPLDQGAQSTICAGGRYDGLIETLGGTPTPAIGWAAGVDRMIINLLKEEAGEVPLPSPSITMAYSGESPKLQSISIARLLRNAGHTVTLAPERSLRSQLRYAASLGSKHVVIIGEKEFSEEAVTLRDMDAGNQTSMTLKDLLPAISKAKK